MNFYKSIRLILPLLLSFLLVSCERHETVYTGEFNCTECYQNKPEWAPLNYEVTINDQNPFIILKVYIGNIEDNNLDWIDTAYYQEGYIDVLPNVYHSVSAEYKDGSNTILAIDGDKVSMKYTSEECDVPCYYFRGGFVDLRLRNK